MPLLLTRVIVGIRHLIAVYLLLILVFSISPVFGQTGSSDDASDDAETLTVNPAMFGFKLPPGKVQWTKRTANGIDKSSEPHQVVRMHVKVGDNFIVILPDGRLAARNKDQIEFTNRPVKWDTPKQIGESFADGRLKNFRVITRKKHVFAYNTSEKMAEVTIRVMESMTRGLVKYMEGMGLKPHEPEVPLVVIMFRTEAQFQAFKPMPPGVVAYYDIVSNRVYLYEESPLFKIDRDLAIGETLSTIAHEGAHQILANIGIQKRLSGWPMWASEGMAEFLAPTTVGRGVTWKGAGQINDMRMLELETYLRSKGLNGIDGTVIQDTVAAARLTSTGYAAAWSLTTYLAKRHRAEFKKFLQNVSQLRPFEGSFPLDPRKPKLAKNRTDFEKYFGKEYKDIETELIKYLTRQKFESPFAKFVHYAVLIELPGKNKPEKFSAVFHTEDLARRWVVDFSKQHADATNPKVSLLKCRNRAEAVQATRLFYRER